jgi:hypothetical protein
LFPKADTARPDLAGQLLQLALARARPRSLVRRVQPGQPLMTVLIQQTYFDANFMKL